VQVSVAAVASDAAVRNEEISRIVRSAEAALRGGRDTLVMTSRKLVTGESKGLELVLGSALRGAAFMLTRFVEKRSYSGFILTVAFSVPVGRPNLVKNKTK
jgi:hypothetical protein